MRKEAVAPAKWLGLIVTLGLIGGCTTIHGYLEPVPAFTNAPGTTHVEMVVATTRTRAETAAVMFAGGRAPEPAFADMVVSIPPDANRQIGAVQWPKQLPGNPETDFVTLKADVINKDQAIATFARLLRELNKSEAMVYVHGFNERYENTVYGFAQILHDSGALGEVAPVLFTWPSKGNVFAYGYDRESSNYSRDALERLLQYLVKEPKVKKITILAHSMGNWVTLEALRQMAIRDGRVAPKIKLVLLASPDVDVDVSREQIEAMGPDRPHIALFVSEDDRALAASKQLWGAPRLGAINPDIEPYKSMLERENISVINLTAFPSHELIQSRQIRRGSESRRTDRPQPLQRSGPDQFAGRLRRENHADHGERGGRRRPRRGPRRVGPCRHRRSRHARSTWRSGR